jgi:hypothetical protein
VYSSAWLRLVPALRTDVAGLAGSPNASLTGPYG